MTQSVHKQQAGFSQTSQIHKKITIFAARRVLPAQTPEQRLHVARLDQSVLPAVCGAGYQCQNPRRESGRRLWAECVALGIDARKAILARCKLLQPFIPLVVDGKPWQAYPTETIASNRRFFSFEPGAKWHGFEGYADDQYFVDPCKLLLTTPVLMPIAGSTPNSASRRPFSPTICVRTVLCLRSAISTRFCSC